MARFHASQRAVPHHTQATTARTAKILMAAEAVLLLLPLTLLTALLVYVSYPAYPLPEYLPLQAVFDAGMLIQVLAIGSAWYLAVRYLRAGAPGLRGASPAWFLMLTAGAVLGLAGAAFAIEHALNPQTARDTVGFALFAPAAALVPPWLHLLRERRRPPSAPGTE